MKNDLQDYLKPEPDSWAYLFGLLACLIHVVPVKSRCCLLLTLTVFTEILASRKVPSSCRPKTPLTRLQPSEFQVFFYEEANQRRCRSKPRQERSPEWNNKRYVKPPPPLPLFIPPERLVSRSCCWRASPCMAASHKHSYASWLPWLESQFSPPTGVFCFPGRESPPPEKLSRLPLTGNRAGESVRNDERKPQRMEKDGWQKNK